MRIVLLLSLIICFACSPKKNADTMNQSLPSTDTLKSFTLYNANGLKAEITNYGGKLVSLWVPDKNGKLGDVVLGYDSLRQYINGNKYFGAMIGRYGNRIAKGKFSLGGKEYQLALNNGANALHGGPKGFHQVFWKISEFKKNSIKLSYHSADGEENYPGSLDVEVTYTLTDNDELIIDYKATTDSETILNLTHHSFFNLAGEGSGDILNHEMMITADQFTPIDSTLIPNGELRNVKGTPFDFTSPHKIGERINESDEQLKFGKGYDHNFVLRKNQNELTLAAKVIEPTSGRVMEVFTTEPGLQFYSGNFLDGKDLGKGNRPYNFRTAFCLEAQHFPDSPNHPNFPSTVLKKGETYTQQTIYKFSAIK
jgi:aldose 1-epimerase